MVASAATRPATSSTGAAGASASEGPSTSRVRSAGAGCPRSSTRLDDPGVTGPSEQVRLTGQTLDGACLDEHSFGRARRHAGEA